ncbi:conserved hypothetical protein [Anaerovirgula multivorans]|uniref:Purine nucleoside phosphorylase n=1 Tax=Anaerovirgula multivorans TaxID=312168 RepID=A0A239CVZ0_9FIRM|nr:peptidoglycan editing factor PgeF [Anaerovirgula multivorans]SNS24237.1 conserved hypothetical protein [Anaerovirgula multivorans]
MPYKIKEVDGMKIVVIEEFQETDLVKHGFSTRIGGVSEGIFNTLNLGLKTKDDREKVLKNIQNFCKAIGVKHENLVLGDQVHSDGIKIANKEDKGKGILYEKDYRDIDGLITQDIGVPLMTFHADCVPLLFLDPVNKGIAASHAGWQGTMLKIGQKTIIKMMEEFNSQPKDILVGIGPSIGKCCYEVSGDVIEKFNMNFTETSEFVFPTAEDKYMLDLWEVNRIALKEIGVLDRNIITSRLCTACDTDLFYSHRKKKGLTGRMASVIELV